MTAMSTFGCTRGSDRKPLRSCQVLIPTPTGHRACGRTMESWQVVCNGHYHDLPPALTEKLRNLRREDPYSEEYLRVVRQIVGHLETRERLRYEGKL